MPHTTCISDTTSFEFEDITKGELLISWTATIKSESTVYEGHGFHTIVDEEILIEIHSVELVIANKGIVITNLLDNLQLEYIGDCIREKVLI